MRNTEGGSRLILTIKLRRGRGVCGWPVNAGNEAVKGVLKLRRSREVSGWPVNTGNEAAEGVSGSGCVVEARDESLGVKYRWLTAAAKILISFLKAVLSTTQYCGQAENSLGLNLPRRVPKSIAELLKAVSEAGSARRREAGVSLVEVMYSITARSSLGIREAF